LSIAINRSAGISLDVDALAPGATVVIIDDDRAVLLALTFALELEGYTVRTYENGKKVLLENNIPERCCFVIDYHLGDLDGLQLLDQMRRRGMSQPALLITGSATAQLRDRARQAGIEIVEKPFLGDHLSERVRALTTPQPNWIRS
jgi:two-component system, LuxR family, response regulator FixJ